MGSLDRIDDRINKNWMTEYSLPDDRAEGPNQTMRPNNKVVYLIEET